MPFVQPQIRWKCSMQHILVLCCTMLINSDMLMCAYENLIFNHFECTCLCTNPEHSCYIDREWLSKSSLLKCLCHSINSEWLPGRKIKSRCTFHAPLSYHERSHRVCNAICRYLVWCCCLILMNWWQYPYGNVINLATFQHFHTKLFCRIHKEHMEIAWENGERGFEKEGNGFRVKREKKGKNAYIYMG